MAAERLRGFVLEQEVEELELVLASLLIGVFLTKKVRALFLTTSVVVEVPVLSC